MEATQIVLASRPKGTPNQENFRFENITLPTLQAGEVRLEPLYISVDPYMRGRMNDAKSYTPPFQVGAPLEGGVVAKVVESKSEALASGDVVLGALPWATQAIAEAKKLQKIDTNLAPASYYLGILGMPGLTAYFGLLDIGQPKEGETVVVSGAAGAVGMVVGQIAKLKGCRVVGLAGSDEKAELLQKEFGYDAVINYKTTQNLRTDLKAACPNGVDVYFDNVGGEITDAVISLINFHARLIICGQIAHYNDQQPQQGPRFLPLVLTRSALIKGFIVSNYHARFPEAMQQLGTWVKEGKLKYQETIIDGFEQLPEAFLGLFTGQNQGKMLVKV
ncbi:NADP-dependent oxidoreductase [Rufibacter glacialis]|uniref:NADP-dependent oxidoreductase n=1 Tax=Rufibacter glacialis TaxID=1259555 RepID=A0A5M8QQE7_9BACT|nr:NADP-dependent oxidoreductase [Rufibacter glacialis]KAA6437451.1 NADP-dependent oxidoreductase [Rufibacter glacialis]GGK59227.1 putative NADP-dependent oxidoreductase YfmJ [Rufibacter glacialis]